MKAPKCPKCGKEHFSTQRCSAIAAEMPSALAPIAAAVEIILPTVKRTITAAEKQKAYRERHKDRVQEADRLRKRKQRESDSE